MGQHLWYNGREAKRDKGGQTMTAQTAPYKTTLINNRRYLGNKYKLLPFITQVAGRECQNIQVVADLFAGTGAVASAFADRRLITNDIMFSNYICNFAWFGADTYDRGKIEQSVIQYNALRVNEENYMTENFADTYFSRADCAKIGYIREDIERRFHQGELDRREQAILITSLLYAMDKIALTCGHYDAYRRGARSDQPLELRVPLPPVNNDPANQCFNEDANNLVKRIAADLVYIDPPYNSRQYCDTYHLLENVARWEKPEVFGVARKMDRKALKSRYCTRDAAAAFEALVADLHTRYILFSYNNMAAKGNDRSNAKLSDEDILDILGSRGEVKVFSEAYKAFSAGQSDIEDHAERLFLCICDDGEG